MNNPIIKWIMSFVISLIIETENKIFFITVNITDNNVLKNRIKWTNSNTLTLKLELILKQVCVNNKPFK